MGQTAWFERIGPGDLQQLVTDIGPTPVNVGVVLTLEVPPGSDLQDTRILLERRLASIPRLRQRLRRAPWGAGRPFWVDDPFFDVTDHTSIAECRPPGDEAAILAAAVQQIIGPLDQSRPLWRMCLLTGSATGAVAVVLVLHHVLADGIGGLAVLAELVDGAGADQSADPPPPRPAPTRAALRREAWAGRRAAVRGLPRSLAALAPAFNELGRQRPGRAPRCSLNAPTGPHRQVAVARVDLEHIRRAARAHGATVNDALLVAVAAALEALLRGRGEQTSALVVSVPVSARSSASTSRLGNEVGVMTVRVEPGSLAARLRAVAAATAVQKTTRRGASSTLIAPAFRLLVAVRLYRPMINRQRMVNVFLTNLPGPAGSVTIGGSPVSQAVPVTMAAGNVAVAFAALSYAGVLSVAIIADPELVPDLDVLRTELARSLAAVSALAG